MFQAWVLFSPLQADASGMNGCAGWSSSTQELVQVWDAEEHERTRGLFMLPREVMVRHGSGKGRVMDLALPYMLVAPLLATGMIRMGKESW